MKLHLTILYLSCFVGTSTHATLSLFTKFPQLAAHIAHIPLCDLPTPIQRLENLGQSIGCQNIFMKRDDLSGRITSDGTRLYGGNKPRKLEFLLADAVASGADGVVTCGSAGSNHALATTVYADSVGLLARLFLKPQPNSHVVRNNLLLDYYYGAELHYFPTKQMRDVALKHVAIDTSWYVIPAGGSTPLGVLGFVNAAFELADQMKRGEIPPPDSIYVALGSCGTVAGLLLGLQAAALATKIIAVCVEPEESSDEFIQQIEKLFVQTNELLHTADATFPIFDFPHHALIVNKKFCGEQYGLFTPEVVAAATLCKTTENIMLDGTYSARSFAAMLDDAAHGVLDGKVVLFWNTYCGLDYSALAATVDYTKLPSEFHHYFEEDVQILDRE